MLPHRELVRDDGANVGHVYAVVDAWGRAQVSTVDSVRLTTEMAALPLVLRLLFSPSALSSEWTVQSLVNEPKWFY